jgi:hypothetical protein
VIAAGLAAVFLIGGPIATATVADSVYRIQLASQLRQGISVRHVAAVLLPSSSLLPGAPGSAAGAFPWPPEWKVRAAWITPDRMRHTGEILLPSPARAGGVVMVWIDQTGRLADPPTTPRQW